jgi:hypothetical protein
VLKSNNLQNLVGICSLQSNGAIGSAFGLSADQGFGVRQHESERDGCTDM